MKYLPFFLVLLVIIANSCKKSITPANDNTPYYEWQIDTLVYDIPERIPPEYVNLQCIWGSSKSDIWAVGYSDIPSGELWHSDGKNWTVVKNWPVSGIDDSGGYINDVFAVTGFDSNNVFVFGYHGYDTGGTAIVLKWNGSNWSTLPWSDGKPPRGGLTWGVKQNNDKLWAVSVTGLVIKYENGFLSTEPKFTDYRFGYSGIAALDNGEVYANVWKESTYVNQPVGTLTKLFKRNLTGEWMLIEDKFMSGTDYDGIGLGRGVYSIGNRLFTSNRGLWERIGNSWIKSLTIDHVGGCCLVWENDIWVYFNQDLRQYNGSEWVRVEVPLLANYIGSYLYGRGWANGHDIFLSLIHNQDTFILHGELKGE